MWRQKQGSQSMDSIQMPRSAMSPLLVFGNRILDSYLFLVGFATLCCVGVSYFTSEARKLKQFPTPSFSVPLLSYIGTIMYFKDPRKFVEDGIQKWSQKPFRIPTLTEWWIIVTEQKLVDELRKAPEHILSTSPLAEEIQCEYTLGAHIVDHPYHIDVIKAQFIRALPKLVPELHVEMVDSFRRFIPPTEDWMRANVLDTMKEIVVLLSGRIFVGLPLSRNSDWNKLNIDLTEHMLKVAFLLRQFPPFLRPLINFFISKVPKYKRDGLKYLAPLISSRRSEREEKGDDYERPADLLTWLMDKAKEPDHLLASRVFAVYFAAIHSTSMALTQALFYLALLPEYLAPLREEVEETTKCEGWTKAALNKMHKIDSFIKESQRLHPPSNCVMTRRALTDYTFSDGTKIPAGSTLSVSATHAHLNPETYEDPMKFDGFRFIKMKERNEAEGLTDRKFDVVTTSLQSLTFGHGRHVCPGRFLAAAEIKMMLAYIITTYDLKLASDIRPPDLFLFHLCIPNLTAEILFRKRRG